MENIKHCYRRWSPRGRPWTQRRPRGLILKSLAWKVKSLVSKPQVLENCPGLGTRTALSFEPLKFCWKTPETSRKICEDFLRTSIENRLKKIFEDLFFWKTLAPVSFVLGLEHSCPWPREGLSSEGLSLALDFFLCPWPWPRALRPRLHL